MIRVYTVHMQPRFLEKYCCFPFSGVRVSYACGTDLKHVLSATHSHLNTPQRTSTPSELWCTGTPVGEGRQTNWEVWGRWVQFGKFMQQKPGPEKGEEAAWVEGWKVGWGRGKGKGVVVERGRHEEWVTEWVKSWRRVGEDEGRKGGGGGGLLPVAIPACPHRQPKKEREKENIWADCRPHDILSLGPLLFLHAEWCAPSLPSHSLPLSLPSPALQSFDMSSPTTKTEVGRLAGATAASGCLALKLPANTAGRGGGGGGGKRQREKDRRREGKEEGDRDRKTQKRDSKRSSEQDSVY